MELNDLAIEPYQPESDEAQVYSVWERALGQVWPLAKENFRQVIAANEAYRAGDHLVARAGQRIIGFAGTQRRWVPGEHIPRGAVLLVMVDERFRRRGIGRSLLAQALAVMRQGGVTRVQLGGGGLSYFWPGVPLNLPDAWRFFEACGWREVERSFDLALTLEGYRSPPEVYERIRRSQVTLRTAGDGDIRELLAFEAQHFPHWLQFYQKLTVEDRIGDVVVARQPEKGIVGASAALYPKGYNDFIWERLLGENTGAVGPLGVAEAARGSGIGLALAARVTELLQERGVRTSYVGWTWLVDWYGKLGYQVWREYIMSWKAL